MDLKWKLVKRPLLLWAQLDYTQKLCKTQTRWSSDGSQIDHHTLIWVCEIYMAIPLSPTPMMSWSLVVVMNSLLSGIFTPVLQLRQFETALICDYDFLKLHFSTQILRISPASRTEAIYWRDERSTKKNRQRIFCHIPYPYRPYPTAYLNLKQEMPLELPLVSGLFRLFAAFWFTFIGRLSASKGSA